MTAMTDLPTVNQALFTKIRDEIEAHPEAHEQDVWETEYASCGTARCTAGWAVHFTHPEDKSIFLTIQRPEYRDGFESAGKMLLGLTSAEAEYLFYADNDEALEMIQHYADNGREGFVVPQED